MKFHCVLPWRQSKPLLRPVTLRRRERLLQFYCTANPPISFLILVPQRDVRLAGGIEPPHDQRDTPPNVVISLMYADVHAAYRHAVSNGALGMAPPEDKPWGMTAGYVILTSLLKTLPSWWYGFSAACCDDASEETMLVLSMSKGFPPLLWSLPLET